MRRLILPLIFILLGTGIMAFTTSEQIFPTRLRITVLNRLGNEQDSVAVTLYANKEDYEASENSVAGPLYTDNKGRVTFDDLEPKMYYVEAIKGDENNYGDAERTNELVKGRLNKVNIVIR